MIAGSGGEVLMLTGGHSDGVTVAIPASHPVPPQWNIPIPLEMRASALSVFAQEPDLTVLRGDVDVYELALADDHRPSRNDRGELVYRYARSW